MKIAHCRTWNILRKLTNEERRNHIVGQEIWRETLKNVGNEKHTLQDMEYDKKQ